MEDLSFSLFQKEKIKHKGYECMYKTILLILMLCFLQLIRIQNFQLHDSSGIKNKLLQGMKLMKH